MIGVFWVYKGVVFGKAIPVAEGEEGVPGIMDSPDTHVEFWDRDTEYARRFPELRFNEYIEIPRGRVVYSVEDKTTIVYMDKVLLSPVTKRQVRDFFDLKDDAVVWRTDPHYVTSIEEIDRLFD